MSMTTRPASRAPPLGPCPRTLSISGWWPRRIPTCRWAARSASAWRAGLMQPGCTSTLLPACCPSSVRPTTRRPRMQMPTTSTRSACRSATDSSSPGATSPCRWAMSTRPRRPRETGSCWTKMKPWLARWRTCWATTWMATARCCPCGWCRGRPTARSASSPMAPGPTSRWLISMAMIRSPMWPAMACWTARLPPCSCRSIP